MLARRWFAVIGGLVLAAAAALVAAPAAQADTPTFCYQLTCDRTEPTTTANYFSEKSCSAGAWTVLSALAFGGLLEQRWGPNCETNWTRFTPADSDEYGIYVVNMRNGSIAGAGSTEQPFYFSGFERAGWTSQVFALNMPALSCVWDVTTNSKDVCVQSS